MRTVIASGLSLGVLPRGSEAISNFVPNLEIATAGTPARRAGAGKLPPRNDNHKMEGDLQAAGTQTGLTAMILEGEKLNPEKLLPPV